MTGADMITKERNRQITELSYDAEHDDTANIDLRMMAKQYIDAARFSPERDITLLVKAGACLAAEIDRLQRVY